MSSQFKKKALSIAVAQAVLICGGAAAQTMQGTEGPTVIVSGQRAAMQSAQKLKQNADEIVDAVVAEEAGKLPDKSITEVLQRVAGVTMDRNRSRGDPEHFSVEGSGITVRGLTWGSSTLNGRESFSAGSAGRELSWGDVPPELMSAVIVHKNPPAELVEGGVSGQVDLRTALPFDYKGDKFAFTVLGNYNALGSKKSPGLSGLYSTRWENSHGQWGALLDLSANETNSHNDTVQLDAFYPRTDIVAGQTVYAPKSASWRTNTSKTDRAGIYGALQWKKNGMQSALTYFHSAYKEEDNEQALFTGVENPYKSKILDPVFDSRGVLQSGTYTYPKGGLGANNFAAGGLGLQADTGFSSRRSQTRELAWNFKWTINESWSVQNDLQWVHATDSANGSVVTLGTFVPSMGIDLKGNPAQISFDANARAFLANPANYYMNFMMPSLSKADGDLYAWKSDARYVFDHPVLRDIRFGIRLTDRKANRAKGSGNEWTSIAEPWSVRQTSVPGQLPGLNDLPTWGGRGNFGYFSDPRYASLVPTTTYGFANFFNGKVPAPPTVVVPTAAFTNAYPSSYQQMTQIYKLQCEDGNKLFGTSNDCSTAGSTWKPLTFDGDPAQTGRQHEKTQAAYVSGSFGFEQLRFPVDGNVGVRVVRTQSVAHGYTVFKPDYGTNPQPEVPLFGKINAPIDVARQYVDVLPSLNLKVSLTDKLQARFAAAKSMYRPGFGDLREYIELNQGITRNDDGSIKNIVYTGKDAGNGNLKPTKADSYDVTLEWYPGNGSSLTAAAFRKNVRDIILYGAYNQSYKDLAGNAQSFLITAPDNSAKGSVTGLELAGQTYFDHVPGLNRVLPEWAKGFGISANYTYINSKQTLYHPFDLKYCPAAGSFNNSSLNLYGCDTNGLPFDSLPLMYLSKNNYNLIFMYDKGPLSARLAYSWRSRFLQGVTVNGTQGTDATSADPSRNGAQDVGWGLPTWQEATGQLDFGIDYRISEHVSASFSASNLTDIIVRQTQQQHIGDMGRSWFEPGRSYRLALRYSY
jgi:TonB-dependent receptor